VYKYCDVINSIFLDEPHSEQGTRQKATAEKQLKPQSSCNSERKPVEYRVTIGRFGRIVRCEVTSRSIDPHSAYNSIQNESCVTTQQRVPPLHMVSIVKMLRVTRTVDVFHKQKVSNFAYSVPRSKSIKLS